MNMRFWTALVAIVFGASCYANAEAVNKQIPSPLVDTPAAAIKTVLEKDGIVAGRVATAGYGEEKAVASNETEEGRAKNRRLELVVVKK